MPDPLGVQERNRSPRETRTLIFIRYGTFAFEAQADMGPLNIAGSLFDPRSLPCVSITVREATADFTTRSRSRGTYFKAQAEGFEPSSTTVNSRAYCHVYHA